MKQKKGQAIFIGLMTAVIVLIVVVQFIGPIKDQIIDARDVTKLDCGNSSITTGTKATCIVIDWTLPYYVAVAIALGVGSMVAFGAKRILPK